MNNVLFRRGDQTFIDKNVPLNDGQIIFNETDEAIYLDNTIGGTVVRKRYGGGNLSRSDIDMALSTTSENPIANKVVTNAIGNLSRLQTDVKTNLVSAINEVDTHTNTAQSTANTANGKADIVQAQVANSGDIYSASKAYAVGDLCIYNNVLYRCITACSAGSWATNQSCFTADTLVNAVNEHYSELTKTDFGGAVDITSYNSVANMYTFPTDGYILMDSNTRTSGIIEVNICSNTGDVITREYMKIVGLSQKSSVYVRKGMKCYIQDRSSDTAVQFRKIN